MTTYWQIVMTTYWQIVMTTYWQIVMTTYWQIVMTTYWQIVMTTYWQIVMTTYWQIVMTTYWQIVMTTYWQIVICSCGISTCPLVLVSSTHTSSGTTPACITALRKLSFCRKLAAYSHSSASRLFHVTLDHSFV